MAFVVDALRQGACGDFTSFREEGQNRKNREGRLHPNHQVGEPSPEERSFAPFKMLFAAALAVIPHPRSELVLPHLNRARARVPYPKETASTVVSRAERPQFRLLPPSAHSAMVPPTEATTPAPPTMAAHVRPSGPLATRPTAPRIVDACFNPFLCRASPLVMLRQLPFLFLPVQHLMPSKSELLIRSPAT